MLLHWFCAWIDDSRDLRGVSSNGNHIRWMSGSPGCGWWRAGGASHWPGCRHTRPCGCGQSSSQWSCLVETTGGATGLRLLSCTNPGPVILKKHQRHLRPRTQMAAVVVVLHRLLMSRYQYLSQSLAAWAGSSCGPRPPPRCSLCPPPRPSCSCAHVRRCQSWSAPSYWSDHWSRGRGRYRWPSCGSYPGWGRAWSWLSHAHLSRSGRGHPAASARPGRWWSTWRTGARSPGTRRSFRLSQLRARPGNEACWGMLRHVEAQRSQRLTCSDGGWPGGCSFSQCSTTVIFPLLSIIFQDGISSWSPRAARVSQTIFGIVDTTETHKFVYFMWEGGLKSSPWLTMSSPAGAQASPGLRTMKIVFSGRVWKYSPSSTWVPSLSRTIRTGSPTLTHNLSRPWKILVCFSFVYVYFWL